MAKIKRYDGDLKAFASNAQLNERTVFGGTNQSDDITAQVTPKFLRGWGMVGASDFPSREDFNAVSFAVSQMLAYIHQVGVAEWNAKQVYYIGSIVNNGAGNLYVSNINNNTGNTLPSISNAEWTQIPNATQVENRYVPKVSGLFKGDMNSLLAPGFYDIDTSATNKPTAGYFSCAIIGASQTKSQLAMLSNGGTYARAYNGSAWSTWQPLEDKELGRGQQYTDMTSQRKPDTLYTNNTGRTITVNIAYRANNTSQLATLLCNNIAVDYHDHPGAGNYIYDLSAIIPAGATYKLQAPSVPGFSGLYWVELR